MRKFADLFLLLICLGLLSALGSARAAEPPETGVTAETLENRIQEVEASSVIGEANKTALLDLYRTSLSLLNQRKTFDESAASFIAARESAPKQAASIRKEIDQLEALAPPQLAAAVKNQPLPKLEQLLLSEKAKMASLRASLVEYSALLEAQSLRAQQARERLEQARLRQAEISTALNIPATPGQSQQLVEARLWAL